MVNSINHHFPSVQPIMKRLQTVYKEGGREGVMGVVFALATIHFPKSLGTVFLV